MSYAVTQRTAEMGIRIALGAMPSNISNMILREVMLLVLIGIAIAIPAAFVCGKLITGMLFGVSLIDPVILLVSGFTLIGVAALAGFIPARRASRIDPIIALRCE
jgi:ABC-type antimicrobial peptide transport system permease subunit